MVCRSDRSQTCSSSLGAIRKSPPPLLQALVSVGDTRGLNSVLSEAMGFQWEFCLIMDLGQGIVVFDKELDHVLEDIGLSICLRPAPLSSCPLCAAENASVNYPCKAGFHSL